MTYRRQRQQPPILPNFNPPSTTSSTFRSFHSGTGHIWIINEEDFENGSFRYIADMERKEFVIALQKTKILIDMGYYENGGQFPNWIGQLLNLEFICQSDLRSIGL